MKAEVKSEIKVEEYMAKVKVEVKEEIDLMRDTMQSSLVKEEPAMDDKKSRKVRIAAPMKEEPVPV